MSLIIQNPLLGLYYGALHLWLLFTIENSTNITVSFRKTRPVVVPYIWKFNKYLAALRLNKLQNLNSNPIPIVIGTISIQEEMNVSYSPPSGSHIY